ncbi:MAG: hypothetical protein JO013_03365 [Alphaproteobacteria bacterium]|nr:hypothetical protein [Alphaproteobacteria bacterium]
MSSTHRHAVLALVAVATAASAASPERERLKRLDIACRNIQRAYPLMMLRTMYEGPMQCGSSDDGSDYVDCDAALSAEEKAAKARRHERAQRQEEAMRLADKACDGYVKDRSSTAAQAAVEQSLANLRANGVTVRDSR